MEQAAVVVEAEEVGVLQVPDQAPPTKDAAPTLVFWAIPVPQPEVAHVPTNAIHAAPADATSTLPNVAHAPQGEASSAHVNVVPNPHNADFFSASIDELFSNIGGGIE
ncbi:unnamed protein product, partial [Ilex paraguariensis]